MAVIFFSMLVLMAVCIYKTKKVEGELARAIELFLGVASVTVLVNAVAVLTTNHFVASVALNAYYACLDWALICMLHFVQKYTRLFEQNVIVRNITIGVAVIDTLMQAVNVFLEFQFNVEAVAIGRESIYLATNFHGYFYLHQVFAYILVFLSAMALTHKTLKTPKFYRMQYGLILGLFVLTVIAKMASLALDSPFDLSLFFYFLLSIAVSYMALFSIPRGLLKSTVVLAMDSMNELVFCFDLWGRCVYINQMTGNEFGDEDIKAKAEAEFGPWIEQNKEDKRDSFQWVVKRSVEGKARYYENIYHRLRDSDENCIGYFFVVSDRTDEVESYQKEHFRMTHDELTGLYSREYFYEQVENKIRKNPQKNYYLMCTNISGFKIYNELFGEDSGEEVLLTQAELMRKNSDILEVYGRLSEDEFGMLMEKEIFSEDAVVKNTLALRNEFSNSLYRMHIYVGVYQVSDREESAALMCNKARLAIDTIRGEYNSYFAYYDEKLLEKTLYERRLVGELEKALEEEQFCIFLQPQVTENGTVVGAEALVRWQHPEKGMIQPGDFIPVFENTGLLWKVDQYVWEEAARRLKVWQSAQKEDWHISVNISPGDFYHVDIYETFVGLVEKYKIDPHNLKLELTETMLMKETRGQLELLQKLRDYGFEIEIDDFGSGYSSLNMLKDISVDVLKLDMGFLRGSDKLERSWAIIQTIVELARELQMKVVTEGVETQEQVRRLREMGCDLYQGYYFAKPMPVSEFENRYMFSADIRG